MDNFKIQVCIKPICERVELEVSSNDTIDSIKTQIETMCDIPKYKQGSIQLGMIINLDDDKTLEFYKINEKSNLYLRLVELMDYMSLQLFVRTILGRTITLNIPNHNTMIYEIKLLIENKTNIPISKQKLYFRDVELENGNTCKDYKMVGDHTLHFNF